MPPPTEAWANAGCAAILGSIVFWCVLWFYWTLSPYAWFGIFLPGVFLLNWFVEKMRALLVLIRVRRQWASRGVRCLVVSSDSVVWNEHVARWLSRLGPAALHLNRSGPREPLAEAVFRAFCGNANYSPSIVVFRGLKRPHVYRFYNAFLEAKRGRPQYVEEQERNALEALA